MKRVFAVAVVSVAVSGLVCAQGRGGGWTTYGGDPQRTGGGRVDTRIAKDTVKDLQLLWKMKLESQPKGLRSISPPMIIGNLITYRGFRELAVTATSSDMVFSLDADLGKLFWQKHLEYASIDPPASGSTWTCPGGLTATLTLPTPGGGRGGPGAPGAPGAGRGPGAAPGPPPGLPPGPGTAQAILGEGQTGGFGGNQVAYTLSSDGRLHRLNMSTGDDTVQPMFVLPSSARASTLNMFSNVVYTATSHGCDGAKDAVWAIDVSGSAPQVATFTLNGGSAWGLGGPVIGNDGTVYVQTGDGPFDPAPNKNQWSNTLLALTPKDLKLKNYFTTSSNDSASKRGSDMNVTAPVVFSYKERDLVVTATGDGRVSLLDSASLGGSDHRTVLYRTPPLTVPATSGNSMDRGIWGGMSTWADADGTRWIVVPVWGPLNPELKAPAANGPAPNGSLVTFRLEEQSGKIVLTPAWVSRDMPSPEPPAIASGVVFALSAGEITRQVKEAGGMVSVDERPKAGTRATLYALDAATGKELYSSRNLITGAAALTGITVANGRVYFGGADGTLYTFGMFMEH